VTNDSAPSYVHRPGKQWREQIGRIATQLVDAVELGRVVSTRARPRPQMATPTAKFQPAGSDTGAPADTTDSSSDLR
jgi:hypothetical protein